MRTPRLPVVDWTDAPADLNGLVRVAKRRNLVSARVPSHFNWPVLPLLWLQQARCGVSVQIRVWSSFLRLSGQHEDSSSIQATFASIYTCIKSGVQTFLFQKSGIRRTDVGAAHVSWREVHTSTRRHCSARRPLAGPLPLKSSFDLGPGYVGFVVDWVALRHVCPRVLRSCHYHSAITSYWTSF
jgi:hypothetical protein